MKNENDKNENKKRGEAAAKQNPQGDGAKYTPLAFARAVDVLHDAADGGFRDIDLAERVLEEAEIEESEDNPGTWFVCWHAKTWREAAAFSAAIVGAAFARGLYADVSADWNIGLAAKDGGRLIDVFVSSADFMTDDGKPVVG